MSVPVWCFGDPLTPLLDTLARGGVLAVPSESSYGLAVDPRDAAAVERVYRLKGRPASKALPVIAADVDQLVALGVDAAAPELAFARTVWPAPLSVVVPLDAQLPAAAGDRTLAVRIPAHEPLRRLLAEIGWALTATSANRAGLPAVLDPGELQDLLAGQPSMIVDGGVLSGGPPSTLAAWPRGQLRVLRQGAYPVASLPATLLVG